MKALIVEDDKFLAESISKTLNQYFQCEIAIDGAEGLKLCEENVYDVIILDIMLPKKNGYEVLEEVRGNGVTTPVLILTAMDKIDDKIRGFRCGADDYLIKPFHIEELTLRILALVRRVGVVIEEDTLKFLNLAMNLKQRKVFIDNHELILKGKQYDLLQYLINNKDTIVTKEQIFDKIWGFNSDTTVNVVEVYASNLRKALKECNYDKYLRTIRGLGYMLSSDEVEHES